jgi:hypothetical protein
MGNSKDSKNSIGVKDILQLVGLIGIGASSFLGLNFMLEGPEFAAVCALAIIAVLYGLVYVLTKLKKEKENPQKAKSTEILVFILGYCTIAVVSGVFLVHFTTVNITKKNDIKNLALNSINDITQMFDDFKTYTEKYKKIYKDRCDEALSRAENKYYMKADSLGCPGTNTEAIKKCLEDLKAVFPKKLAEDGKFTEKEVDADKYVSDIKTVVNNWDSFELIKELKNLNSKKAKYLNDLDTLSVNAKIKGFDLPAFNTQFSFKHDADILPLLKEIHLEDANWTLVIVAFLILHFLTLLPWISERVHRIDIGDNKIKIGKEISFK